MPKYIEYPKRELKPSLELARAVYDLGGSCSEEMCAEKLGKKVSGAFGTLVSATIKYGLIEKKKGQLTVTALFRDYINSYSEEEALFFLQQAFVKAPTFQKIVDRFTGQKVPIAILDKLLVREFGVNRNDASRVSGYFTRGAKFVGLMDNDGTIFTKSKIDLDDRPNEDRTVVTPINHFSEIESESIDSIPPNKDVYVVNISGPGVNTTLEINEPSDLTIVEVFLQKVKRSFDNRDE